MAEGVDFAALRARVGNLRSADLLRAAEACGWLHKRTRGGHHQLAKAGYRTLTIPASLRPGTARSIIKALEESSND